MRCGGWWITRRWSGPRRRYTLLAVERRVPAAAAAQRHYVMQHETNQKDALSKTGPGLMLLSAGASYLGTTNIQQGRSKGSGGVFDLAFRRDNRRPL